MRISRRSYLVFLCATGCGAGPLAAEKPQPADISQTMLEALIDVSGVPGFGAAVWRDGTVVWIGAAGKKDVESGLPVDGETQFRLASVSKLLTVTAAAKLAEEGRLDIDAPIGTILPWSGPAWKNVTLRQLAAHTSGMPHYQIIDLERGKIHFATGREASQSLLDRDLLFSPGTDYSYSSWGYTVMGAAIEEASGQAFADYVAKEVTPQLAISRDRTDSGDADVSVAYQVQAGDIVRAAPHDFSYTWGGGGMMASAEALVSFGGRMLENRIVSSQTFDAMVTPFTLESGEKAGDDGYTVGFGWRASHDSDGHSVAFHNGVTVGARSSLVLWREEATAAAILSNMSWVSSIDTTAQMLAAPFRISAAEKVAAECPTTATRYEGRLGDKPIAGPARFTVIDGICRGEIANTGELAAYFANGVRPDTPLLRLVGIDQDSGLSRAAIATPYGLYDLRAQSGTTFGADLSSSRRMEFSVFN